MTARANGLRAARTALGWSQAQAARQIAELGVARGAPVAAAASLKTLLSRWENGHAVPEPQYRALLGELFSRSPAELGIDHPPDSGGGPGPDRLRAAIGAAAGVDDHVVRLWREQLGVARRLDDELGDAGAGGLVRAQVEQLDHTLIHTLMPRSREVIAELLAAAATLAGAQALDRADHDHAWRYYERARCAASEAGLPVTGAIAWAGLASVLIDADDPKSALALLGDERPAGPSATRVRWEAARGLARAAAGEPGPADTSFAEARRALRDVRVDVVRTAEPSIELADLHRWHGHALVTLGDSSAVGPLEKALASASPSVRHRAGLHADLADALRLTSPAEAAAHAGEARALASRIGSARITERLTRQAGRSSRHVGGGDRRSEPSVDDNSSAAR